MCPPEGGGQPDRSALMRPWERNVSRDPLAPPGDLQHARAGGHPATGLTRRVRSRAKIPDPWGLCSVPGPRAVFGLIHTKVGL